MFCTVSFLAGALALLAQGSPNGGTGGPEVLARPRALVFHMAEGGDNPDPRSVTVSSPTGGASFEWEATLAINTPPAGDWFQIDLGTTTSGTGPGTITVTVDGSGLSAGRYDGLITVTSGDTSVEVSVRLLVRPPAPANLVIHPRAFNFILHPDGPPPASKTLHVKSAGHEELDWTAEASTSDGDWLLIPSTTSDTGTTPDTIELTVDPTGLVPGHYTGMVEVSAGDQTKTARVWLRIVGQSGSGGDGAEASSTSNQTAVQISPPVVNFTATNGTTAPASVDVRLHSSLSGLTFTATPITSSGGDWLNIEPELGEIPGTINVSATPGDLPTGIYIGLVMLEIDGTVMEQRSIPVVLRIGTPAGLPRLAYPAGRRRVPSHRRRRRSGGSRSRSDGPWGRQHPL